MENAENTQTGVAKQPSNSSMSASQSSPSRRQQQRIHFPQTTHSSPSSEAGPSSPIGAGLRSLEAHAGRNPNRISQVSMQANEPFAEQRRRVRSVGAAPDTLRPSSTYSRSQYVTGTMRSDKSSRRIVSYSPESYQRPVRSGASSIGSSPLAAGALLPPDDGTQGESLNLFDQNGHLDLQQKALKVCCFCF